DAACRGPQNELEAALELAHDYRAHLLRASDFTDIGQDRCNDGWLRGFPRDSTDTMREATADLVDKLEKLIQAYAVDAPLDTPEGHELLRTVLLWETGRERPRWDVWSGKPSREAIAAGLTEQVADAAGRCLVNARGDTAAYVLPMLTGLALPSARGVRTTLVFGDRGLSALRSRHWGAPMRATRVRCWRTRASRRRCCGRNMPSSPCTVPWSIVTGRRCRPAMAVARTFFTASATPGCCWSSRAPGADRIRAAPVA
ncbi:MAG: hypothetical protein HC938_16055, partial [Nitrospira sp.]|nr:hypothetical protein [Nitrospira sp.]